MINEIFQSCRGSFIYWENECINTCKNDAAIAECVSHRGLWSGGIGEGRR